MLFYLLIVFRINILYNEVDGKTSIFAIFLINKDKKYNARRKQMRKLENYLIPLPQKIEQGAAEYTVADFCGKVAIRLSVKCDLTRSALEVVGKKLADLAAVTADGKRGDYRIAIKVDPDDPAFDGIESYEAYYVKTARRESILCGKTPAGAFYAAVTFAQMLSSGLDSVIVPEAYVLDWPDTRFRGHSIDTRYGNEFMTREDYFNMIDYFADQKINILMVNLYNCWNYQYDNDPVEFLYTKIPGHPEIKTPMRMKYYSVREGRWVHKENLLPSLFEDDFFPEVVRYGKKKNIVVAPKINTLGHNTLIPRLYPEISAKNEDGTPKNMGFCTNNPKTYELVFGLMDKLIDKYILPFGNDEIHLGLDEIYETFNCKCPKCRELSGHDIFVAYAIKLAKHAKERGIRTVYMSHDMFISMEKLDDSVKQVFVDAGVDDVLTIGWWTYEDPIAGLFYGKSDKVNPILRSRIHPYSGYQNWMAIQETQENIRGCVKLGYERGFEGVIAYGAYDPAFDRNFLTIADVAWNRGEVENPCGFDIRYAEKYYPKNKEKALAAFRAFFEMAHDDVHQYWQNRLNRWLDYYMFSYRDKHYDEQGKLYLTLRNYPGTCYTRLINSDRVDVAYLEMVKKNAAVCLEFFENSGRYDAFNDMWLLTCRHYERAADEFLTVLGLYKEYNDGAVDARTVICELDRLVSERERLMSFVECAKLEHTRPTYLRNMSVVRQYMIDLRDYFCRELKAGNHPKFDVTNLDYAMSERFSFLR